MIDLTARYAWVYAIPLGQDAGLCLQASERPFSIVLETQVIAGIGAMLVGIGLMLPTQAWSFTLGIGLLGAFCIIVSPFQIAYLIAIDPTRRAAMQS